jgi:hypothetical protein
MARNIGPLALAALALCLLSTPEATSQFYGGAAAYNPLTGGAAAVRGSYNPYTGGMNRSAAAYNPYTGTGVATRAHYNPLTGNAVRATTATNPYTGRSATVVRGRRGW